jgi:HCOMODA/2-hydroxy-3-carboxy-muconic semialdehyde decarboxylase
MVNSYPGAGFSASAGSASRGSSCPADRPSRQRPAAAGVAAAAVIEDLVAANLILAREQVLDAFGHVSVRHPVRPDRFLLARSVAPALVTAADLMEYDLDANPVDARGRASYRERFIHSEIYRARGDVKAIVHCHTASLIPFGVTGVPLRPITIRARSSRKASRSSRSATAGMTDMLIGDGRLGRALAQTLGSRPAVLMRSRRRPRRRLDSHVVGRSVYLDVSARAQAQAMALGGTITYLDAEEARRYVAPNNYDRAWELWKKQISREVDTLRQRSK